MSQDVEALRKALQTIIGSNGDRDYMRAIARVALAAPTRAAEQAAPDPDYPCRPDGRCQYAIDHGAEGDGHCPHGKCVMAQQAAPAPKMPCIPDGAARPVFTLYNGSTSQPYIDIDGGDLWCNSDDFAPDERWKIRYMVDAANAAPLAAAAPIDMVLHCPACGTQHIDAPEEREYDDARGHLRMDCNWTNPPHRSHLCSACEHIWRPADVPTNGVAAIKTKGGADSPAAASPQPVAEIVHRLRSGADRRQYHSIGDLWNLCDEAADLIESAIHDRSPK